MPERTCSVEGCERAPHARGFCPKHYGRWSRYGCPTAGGPDRIIGQPERRFRMKTVIGSVPDYAPNLGPCWLWVAGTNAKDYGVFVVDGRDCLAHRFSYELHVGPIPEGLQLDHLCRVHNCVNPDHLEPVTPGENSRRGSRKRGNAGIREREKTHCIYGHPFDEENTLLDEKGWRTCLACRARRREEHKLARRKK
jgi:hypothetical protein